MKLVAIAWALVACTPRNDPQGPGTLPEPVEGTVATSAPVPPRAPRSIPNAPVVAPVPPPEEVPPPRAKIVLVSAQGSAIKGELSILQGDDDTHVSGTLTGLAKNAAYTLGKRDQCASQKADDDSRRSSTLVYGVTFKANAAGVATIDDTSTAIHLDGPLSLMGAIFVVSKTTAGKELACGRVVAP